MNWVNIIRKAIGYIEDNILNDITSDNIAESVHYSKDYLKKIFHLVTGYTISEYIRNRRLSLAGKELYNSKTKVIDVALKYGYDTPESFTKAFTRFHGVTPSAAKKQGNTLLRFDPLTIEITVKGGFNVSRKIIPNVPLVTISGDGYSYLTSYVGAIYAALHAMNEPVDYSELLFVSGAGNRLCWTEGKWVFGNEDIANCGETTFEIQDRLLKAYGWNASEVILKRDTDGITNIPIIDIEKDIISSIDRGIPIMVQGLMNQGSPNDYSIIYGYEADGEKLLGWSYYQEDLEPFVVADWKKKLRAYILIEEKTTPMSERERILTAFRAIVKHTKQGEIRGRKVGFAAWESMLYQLEHDDFSHCTVLPSSNAPDNEHGVNSLESRFIIYCDALCQINERGAKYIEMLITKFPEWSDELTHALKSWKECSSYGGYLWSQGFSFDERGFKKFGEKDARKVLADEGKRSMQKDIEAIKCIEQILEKEAIT